MSLHISKKHQKPENFPCATDAAAAGVSISVDAAVEKHIRYSGTKVYVSQLITSAPSFLPRLWSVADAHPPVSFTTLHLSA